MICPRCKKQLSNLLVEEPDFNVINKKIVSLKFCVPCQKLYWVVAKEFHIDDLEKIIV